MIIPTFLRVVGNCRLRFLLLIFPKYTFTYKLSPKLFHYYCSSVLAAVSINGLNLFERKMKVALQSVFPYHIIL